MTPKEARQLRRDVPLVLAEVARHAERYDINPPRGRQFYTLRNALPRFGHGERVSAKHLTSLATVASWVCDFMEWAQRYHPRLRDVEVEQAADRLLSALANVDIRPAAPPTVRRDAPPQRDP